jgi:hypothetical protein
LDQPGLIPARLSGLPVPCQPASSDILWCYDWEKLDLAYNKCNKPCCHQLHGLFWTLWQQVSGLPLKEGKGTLAPVTLMWVACHGKDHLQVP